MPPDLPNEQELNLKKRARRRLVGAIALVLLMVIFLPQVLQDRVALTQHESIKITMPDSASPQGSQPVEEKGSDHSQPNEAVAITEELPVIDAPVVAEDKANTESELDSLIASKDAESKKNDVKKPEIAPSEVKVEKNEPVKVAEAKASEAKKAEVKPAPSQPAVKEEPKATETKPAQKQSEHFTVQVGVYTDMANVKRLQEQLKQAGYSTATEKITTSKGESIRLKAGSFSSRQDAVNALDKLKAMGLPGMVIGNN